MLADFTANGFHDVIGSVDVSTGNGLKRGDVLRAAVITRHCTWGTVRLSMHQSMNMEMWLVAPQAIRPVRRFVSGAITTTIRLGIMFCATNQEAQEAEEYPRICISWNLYQNKEERLWEDILTILQKQIQLMTESYS